MFFLTRGVGEGILGERNYFRNKNKTSCLFLLLFLRSDSLLGASSMPFRGG